MFKSQNLPPICVLNSFIDKVFIKYNIGAKIAFKCVLMVKG